MKLQRTNAQERDSARRYALAGSFMKKLMKASEYLTEDQVRTLRNLALIGETESAERGLEKIMKKQTEAY